MYRKLSAFKKMYGHCNVLGYPQDKAFGAWVRNQRVMYKNNKLSEERIKLLQ